MYQDIKELAKEIEEMFGTVVANKVFSHLSSCYEREKELIRSRDNWREKYEELKSLKLS